MGVLVKWTLGDLIEVIERTVSNKFDVIIFVEGNRGLGKSTLLYKLGVGLNGRGIVKFNPISDLVYTRNDTIKRLANSTKRFIFSDELINVAYNRDFYEQDQKVLLKALNMYRDSCNVFAGAIPRFIDLDNQIQRLCKIRISIIRRGVALIQTQIRGIYRRDPWDMKNNLKIEEDNYKKLMPYAKLTTIRGILKFGDLPPLQRARYEGIKQEKRNKIFNSNADDTKDVFTKFEDNIYKNLIAKRLSASEFEMSIRLLGRNSKHIRNKLNERLKADGYKERVGYFFKEQEKNEIKKRKMSKMIIKPEDSTPFLPHNDSNKTDSHVINQNSPNQDIWGEL